MEVAFYPSFFVFVDGILLTYRFADYFIGWVTIPAKKGTKKGKPVKVCLS
jgi:hypothetical protein